MRILDENRVYLEKGEIVPVFCSCGEVYQPEKDSECSDCPKCGRLNHHETGNRAEYVSAEGAE